MVGKQLDNEGAKERKELDKQGQEIKESDKNGQERKELDTLLWSNNPIQQTN